MNPTQALQIRAAAASAIVTAFTVNGNLSIDGGVVAGRKTRPMPEQVKRQVFVYLDYSKLVARGQYTASPDDWGTRLRIECAARASDGNAGDAIADDLASGCYAALAADKSLGGLCSDLEPVGIAWDAEEADAQVAITQLLLDARHRTSSTSIASS